MVFRCQESADDREPLRGDRDSALVATLDKLRYSPRRVARVPQRIQQPEFFHDRPPTLTDTNRPKPADSCWKVMGRQSRMIRRLDRYLPLHASHYYVLAEIVNLCVAADRILGFFC
jgi:hypothetical protein